MLIKIKDKLVINRCLLCFLPFFKFRALNYI